VGNVYKPGLIQIRPQYSFETDAPDKPENVTFWRSGSLASPLLSDLVAFQTVFDTDWGAVFASYGANDAHYTGSVISDWSSASGPVSDSVGSFTPVAGGQGAAAPPQIAILMSWPVPIRYRGGHGRTYLPYVGFGSINTAGFADHINNAATIAGHVATLRSDLNAVTNLGGITPVQYRYRTDPVKAEIVVPTDIVVDDMLATQRRRIRRVAHR
jgi:hypothetical protein